MRRNTMRFHTLTAILFCILPSCDSTEELHDNRSLRLELPYQSDTELIRRGGVDGAQDHALALQNGLLKLQQGARTIQIDLDAFPGDTFVVYGTGLILPVVLDLPDGTRLHWRGSQLKLGERILDVPRRGSFRYDAARQQLIANEAAPPRD
jgi:hypothetical protein